MLHEIPFWRPNWNISTWKHHLQKETTKMGEAGIHKENLGPEKKKQEEVPKDGIRWIDWKQEKAQEDRLLVG